MNALRTLSLLALFGCGAVAGSPEAVRAPPNMNPMVSIAPLVEAVEPAVVNVYVSASQQIPKQYQRFYGLPAERTVQGQGSGFVISPDGYILTNNHVIAGATDIKVKFASGSDVPAKVVGTDPDSDIALLKIDVKDAIPFLRLGSSDGMRVGDWAVAVGNPLGLGHTVTMGIISGKGRNIPDIPFEEFLQTDASINPGNSGGPLIALDGTVIGMNTAIVQGANSVGFAIPSDHIAGVLPQLRENGKVARGFLGVEMVTDIPDAAQKALGAGVLVGSVSPEGPAAKAGIRSGDLVIGVGDAKVADAREMVRAVSSHAPGKEVVITVMREGKEKRLTVKLGERPAS